MPDISQKNVNRAMKNVIAHGDTDVFSHSFENYLLRTKQNEFKEIILELDVDFKKSVETLQPQFENTLCPAGYNGYRWVTQIDPFWNCHYLSSVIRHGDNIEQARIPIGERCVHSYRFEKNEENESLFSRDWNWHSFMAESYSRAEKSEFVILTDISEFYRRTYHHRIKNALSRLCKTNVPTKIDQLLSKFSLGTSYGLPVGGAASRLIAEILLNQIDHLLRSRDISFCRFVDDFHIFAASEQEAYHSIQVLSELLITNQGLTLQKSKTRIMSSGEFTATFPNHLKPGAEPSNDRERLFNLSLNFDPYSPTADADYEALKGSLGAIDFLALLNEELSKSQAHGPTISKLIRALKITDGQVRTNAIKTLMDNIHLLYPVFSQLLIVLISLKNELSAQEIQIITRKIIQLIKSNSYLMALDIHRCYSIKLLNCLEDYEVDTIYSRWLQNGSPLLKRDVVMGFVARKSWHFISDFKNNGVVGASKWVRRAMITASYGLGDEGNHWRNAQQFDRFELFTKNAASDINLEDIP